MIGARLRVPGRDGRKVRLQSRAGQPLERYFPELAEQFQSLGPSKFVPDGEIAVPMGGDLSFDDLLLRIHPAASLIAMVLRSGSRRGRLFAHFWAHALRLPHR